MKTEAERKAMEWLDKVWGAHPAGPAPNYAGTIKRMLSRPVLPEEPSDELIEAMVAGFLWPSGIVETSLNRPRLAAYREQMRKVYRHQHAHLTAPKTKEVEVYGWALMRGDYVITVQQTQSGVEAWIPGDSDRYTVIRLTGKATVPA